MGPLSAVAVGGYIVLAGLWSSPVSGASMKARSFGPDLALGDYSNYWVYVVGPIAGAVLAVGFAWILRGGSLGGLRAARGLTGRDAALASGPDDPKETPMTTSAQDDRRAPTKSRVEHPSVAERVARGQAARARCPARPASSTPAQSARTRSPCSRARRRPACPSWCRSATGACLVALHFYRGAA